MTNKCACEGMVDGDTTLTAAQAMTDSLQNDPVVLVKDKPKTSQTGKSTKRRDDEITPPTVIDNIQPPTVIDNVQSSTTATNPGVVFGEATGQATNSTPNTSTVAVSMYDSIQRTNVSAAMYVALQD